MNLAKTVAIALAVMTGAPLLDAAPAKNPRLDPGRNPKPMATVQPPQLTGTIRWHVAEALAAHWSPLATGGSCRQFQVEMKDKVSGGEFPKYVTVGSAKGAGTMKSGSCSYWMTGLPTGKSLEIHLKYSGVNHAEIWTNGPNDADTLLPLTFEDHKAITQDLQLDFYCPNTAKAGPCASAR